MFEKLFVKTSDLVFHTIAPYAVERERFLAHCGEEGFSKVALRRIAGIVVTAACDLHAHGGLEVDQKRLEAAAGRIEMTRRQAGVRDDAREYRREFLRVTTRWVLFLGRLQPQAPSPGPCAALLDDFERWMTEERGLSRGTLKGRRWHVGRFLDWLHERQAPVPGLSPRDLDGYLQHLDAQDCRASRSRFTPTPYVRSSATPSGADGAPPDSPTPCMVHISIVTTGCPSVPHGMTSIG